MKICRFIILDQKKNYHRGATRFIGEYYKFNGKYEFSETFPGSVSRRCPDITKAKDLDYLPSTEWREECSTLKWYENYLNNNNTKESFYDQYGVKK